MVSDVKPGGMFMINCQWTPEELEQHLPAEAKRYIANNDIQLYTINAIDLAVEIGMGKRTNTILQSAFFTLANVMPQEEAIQLHEGRRHALLPEEGPGRRGHEPPAPSTPAPPPSCKIDVPAAWADAEDDAEAADARRAAPSWSSMVREIMEPVGQHGRRQPARLRLRGPRRRPVRAGRLPPTRSAAWP